MLSNTRGKDPYPWLDDDDPRRKLCQNVAIDDQQNDE